MFKSMMRKELMETLPITVIALLIYGGTLLGNLIDAIWKAGGRPFDQLPANFSEYLAGRMPVDLEQGFWIMPLIFALALGLVQTLSDSVQGTWGYLMHLPPGRRKVIATKLTVGVTAYLSCTGLFILACVTVALRMSSPEYPLEWPMVSPYVQLMLIGVLIYLGTFLSGLRPARWYGSRLIPLARCCMVAWVLAILSEWWIVSLLVLSVVCGMLVCVILQIGGTRDFA
ncbi:hypothetical protein [Symmachiella dynata]|uniref:hypothetical protein n=1 Tax=Symmachiella dynata TaxID=2527995 RepID=UPI0030EF88E1|tara:strand:+ start:203 stop:886 length:684 start_codon:yes stop_codon:yes gene_type:complete